MTARTTLDELNTCDPETFVARIGDVWEHAPWVAEAAAARRPYGSVDALHRAMAAIVAALPEA